MVDQKGMLNLEVEKNGCKYSFLLPVGTKWGDAYDAAYEILMSINDFAKKAAEQAKRKEVEE